MPIKSYRTRTKVWECIDPRALGGLEPAEEIAVRLYYSPKLNEDKRMTQVKIANMLGVTRGRAGQILRGAIKKLHEDYQ